MATLSDTQRLLWRLITAPEGVAAALAADRDRGGTLTAALHRAVRGDTALDAVARLDIYANMYFFRVLDVLKEAYPGTLALLGAVPFHNLATDYLLDHPPTHFSIREAGRHLPECLDRHPARRVHPCGADLARLERALNDAFDADDAPALRAADLADVAAAAWPTLRLALHPSVHLLECAWPVQAVRQAVDRGERAFDPLPGAVRLCVWRKDLTVFHRTIEAAEYAALRAVAGGADFAGACAAALGHLPEDEADRRLASALTGWLAEGWLAAPDGTGRRAPAAQSLP